MTRRTAVFITVHKGASTFIADTFADAASSALPDLAISRVGSELIRGRSIEDIRIPRTDGMVVRVYPRDIESLQAIRPELFTHDGGAVALVYRDPRDVAVSMYYSTAYSHNLDVADPAWLLERRSALLAGSVQDGVEQCVRPAIREFKTCLAFAGAHPHALVSTYEQLVTDYDTWLDRHADHFGWPDGVRRAVHEQTAVDLVPPDTEDVYTHKRRVTPGNWRDVFDDRLRSMFEDLCSDELAAAGYTW